MSIDFEAGEPSPDDLAAIEAEWPRIADGLAVLEAEIQALYGASPGPSELTRRRRHAEAHATRQARKAAARGSRHVCDPWRCSEVALTSDCRYGCKVMRCDDCGAEHVSHRAVYGCPIGRTALQAAA